MEAGRAKTPSEAVRALARGSVFEFVSERARQSIAARARVYAVSAGSALTRAGDAIEELFVPLDGRLQLHASDGAVHELAAGRALELRAVTTRGFWEYSAVAASDVHVLAVPIDIAVAALKERPSFYAYLQIVTSVRGFRQARAALRSAGADQAALEALASELRPNRHRAGDVLSEPGRAGLFFPESGSLALALAGDDQPVGEVMTGEFVGTTTITQHGGPVRILAVEDGLAYGIPAGILRQMYDRNPRRFAFLAKEHPQVVSRLRPVLINRGLDPSFLVGAPAPAADEQAAAREGLGAPVSPEDRDSPRLRRWLGVTARRDSGDHAAEAAASVLKFFEVPASAEDLARRLRRKSASLLDLGRIIEPHGFLTQSITGKSVRALGRFSMPLLTKVRSGYVVVHRVTKSHVIVFDPASGLRQVSHRDFERNWSRQALVVEREPEWRPRDRDKKRKPGEPRPAEQPSQWARWLPFLQVVGREHRLLYVVASLSVLLFAVGLLSPRLNQLVIDRVLVLRDPGLLNVVAGALALVAVTELLFIALRQLVLMHLNRVVGYRLGSLLYRHALSIPVKEHARDRVGTVSATFSELRRIQDAVTTDLVTIFLQVISAIIFSLILLTYSVEVFAIPVITGIVAVVIARIGGSRFRTIYRRLFKAGARVESVTTEQVEGMPTLKALGAELAARNSWQRDYSKVLSDGFASLRVRIGVGLTMSLAGKAAQLVGIYLVIRLVFGGSLSAGAVVAVTQYLGHATSALVGIATYLDELYQLRISFDKVEDIFHKKFEDPTHGAISLYQGLSGRIALKNVSFRYHDEAPTVVDGVELDIAPGEVVALVGRSGSGKTTLAKLIAGMLSPTEGVITYDDHEARALGLECLRSQVGMVMQDSELLAGTIAENIAYGDDRLDENRLRAVAELAAADGFIGELPGGYQTYLAEGGLGLSGGQTQRIAIARALYHDPSIIIFDEATSSLDAESEEAILRNMSAILSHRTAIVIAHRLNTVRNADRIVVVDRGTIAEQGTHDELIARGGLYASLHSRSMSADAPL